MGPSRRLTPPPTEPEPEPEPAPEPEPEPERRTKPTLLADSMPPTPPR